MTAELVRTGPEHPQPPNDVIRVQLSLAAPDGTTRFVDQIVGGAGDHVRFAFFGWRAALSGSYDVFHLHWPEHLVSGRGLSVVRNRVMLLALVCSLTLRRIPIMRTAHNLRPHAAHTPMVDRALFNMLDRRTVMVVTMNESTPVAPDKLTVTIPHGDYRERFGCLPSKPAVPGRVLFFGLVKRYKGIEALVRTFSTDAPAEHSLRIVGAPLDDAVVDAVVRAGSQDDRISWRFEFVSDPDLVQEVTAASVVVLPYREMHNSGAVLVALSLARPVIAPRTPVNLALAAEVGASWLTLYDGELDYRTIATVLRQHADPPGEPPTFVGRTWPEVGAGYERAYRSTIAAARAGRAGAR